jgi:hypothetical protein
MEIREKTINNNNWQLINESWETRNSWGHKTTILRNDFEFLSHKIKYYNRTWENYRYQTCMRGAIEELREQQLSRYIDDYKYNNNISRFRKGEKEEVLEAFKETEISKELDALEEEIKTRQFD